MPKYTFGYSINGKGERKSIRAIDEGSAQLKAEDFLSKLRKKNPTDRISKGFMYEE